ncbi:MAG: Sll0314/Alr1548 family TPR repeat-containing protein [Oculatellaceae cyanobacterium bins.114]|nr:Sll0314/Alr1548 family TPR repeat-containing protein [Oculatellaceae cyanobacterium bins.114]
MASVCPTQHSRRHSFPTKRLIAAATGSLAIALSLFTTPAWAGDPFRNSNPRPIDSRTETAFRAMFEQGDYVEAANLLERPTANEPLAHALRASLAYIDQDWDTLGSSATQTSASAAQLVQTDPLRGHLYLAVGHFLEGAHILTTQGTLAGTPAILGKLQQVFDELDQAEAIDPNDPELNLIRGYMDLMLAVNLPFSDPDDAIARLQNYAAPTYLAQRGIALGYRDLRQPELARAAVERALSETPNNPDLLYLKAQILVRQGQEAQSLRVFAQALAQQAQLPQNLVNQIAWEECRTRNRVRGRGRNCDPLLERQRQG